MKYMINVDLEVQNEAGGTSDCQSELHRQYGRYYDLTVHELRCTSKRASSADRENRYWDDNSGNGFSLEELIAKLKQLQIVHSQAHPRRCLKCRVEANLPHWD